MFGRDQVLLQVLLRSGAGAETPFVIFLQSCHRVLQTADILSFNGQLEEPTNPKRSQLLHHYTAAQGWKYICQLSHYRIFILAPLEVLQSSLSSGFLIQCAHRLGESIRQRLPGYIRCRVLKQLEPLAVPGILKTAAWPSVYHFPPAVLRSPAGR